MQGVMQTATEHAAQLSAVRDAQSNGKEKDSGHEATALRAEIAQLKHQSREDGRARSEELARVAAQLEELQRGSVAQLTAEAQQAQAALRQSQSALRQCEADGAARAQEAELRLHERLAQYGQRPTSFPPYRPRLE